MSDTVQLLVPADGRFREIVAELAGKFCLAQGGSETDAVAVSASVSTVVRDLITGNAGDISVDLRAEAGMVEVTVRYGGRASVVTQSLSASRAAT